jgi:hypothetical protein
VGTDDGYVALPQRTSIAIAVSFALALIGQTAGLAWYASKLDSRVAELELADRRLSERGDERFKALVMRLDTLERDRDRLARLEERVTVATDLLREIRSDMRGPRR